jgi:hypothetical protein
MYPQTTDFRAYGDPMPWGPWAADEQGEMAKALTAGTETVTPGAVAGEGFPLRPESLDGTLYNLTYRMEHLTLWPQLLKDDVWNTVNEYNVLRAHGSGVEFFHGEGDLPGEDDSTWERLYATIKHMGCTRRFSLVSSLVRMAHNNAETHQTIGGTMWTLEQLEKNLFTGNDSLLSESIKGYDQQITHVRDLRGRPLTGDEINYGAGVIVESPNWGRATDAYMPIGVDTDFVDDVLPNARYQAGQNGGFNGQAGMTVDSYKTQRGTIKLNPTPFLDFGSTPSSVALGNAAKRPGTPTENTALAASGSGSKFEAADAGTYRYKVVAVNRYGKSAPLSLSTTIAVTAGQSVTFKIADGSPIPAYYEVYRSTKGGAASTCKYAFKVARDSSGVTTITDTNAYIPGTARVYLVQQNREFNVFQRLLRFMKVRLGMVDASFRFMLLLFGELVVHAPNKAMIFINVGRANRDPHYDVS